VIRYSTCFNVRTALPPARLGAAIRHAIAGVDPNVPIAHVTTLDDLRDANIGQERLLASLCATLAGLALLLSCIGLYGLMAYHVTRRRREIAIRMAIGAYPRDVARAILGEAFGLAVAGIALGLPAVFAATRFVQSQLYGVQPNDPATLALVAITLLSVALLAAWLPARRATRIDPIMALRAE
jgi:ABC-type antimicrobial peptide transport system permease subunit